MSSWKTILLLLVIAAALWLLYPSRQLEGPADPSVVEIHFMAPPPPVGTAILDLVRDFEAHSVAAHAKDPNRPIYRVVAGHNAARDQVSDPTRFLVSVAGGMPPDVIHFDRYAVAEWAARGAFEPLDAYIRRDLDHLAAGRATDFAPDDVPTAERFYKACWEEGKYKEGLYAIPVSVDDRALYYNEDLLIAAGYKTVGADGSVRARPPKTWRELAEYAVKLTRWEPARPPAPDGWDIAAEEALIAAGWKPENVQPPLPEPLKAYAAQLADWAAIRKVKVLGFPGYYGNSWLYMYGWMNGGRFMSPDRTRCTLNDPRIVEALEYLKRIYDLQGGYQTAKAFEVGFQQNEMDPFIQGKVAMKIDVGGAMQRQAMYGRDMNFGIAPNPMPQRRIDELTARGETARISWSGGWAYAIPSTARNKDAAWELIRFLASDRAFRGIVESERMLAESQGRLFVPRQCPVKKLNEEFYERYILNSGRLPARFKEGCKVFNDLLPYAKFRPVTPVGQLLWNKHRDAAEEVLNGSDRTPREALDFHTASVQRRLDEVLHPAPGTPIRGWGWFFSVYGLLLIVTAAAVVLWDTRKGFRRRIGRLLGLSRAKADATIEGSAGGYFRKQWLGGYVCAAPWILGFIVMAGGPMLFSLVMSFCDFDVINPAKFVGASNYEWMLSKDELFWKALANTAFMIVGVPMGMAVSLLMAMLLNAKVRGIAVWRTFFYLPAIVPMVAASMLWIWIFNPQGGFLNQLLEAAGLPGPLWLQDRFWSKPALILMGLWGAGGGMIIWLAGLKGIPKQLYEAADVDGAGILAKFRHVTIPQLTPYIFFNLVMGIIRTFQIFGQAFIMTQGGPDNSTLFYVYHLFNNAFRYGQMGYAAAMAWFLFAIVFLLTLIQMKFSKRWVHYEAA